MSGHGELLSAAHASRLNEDDVAASWRPNQPHRNARLLNAILHFALCTESRNAQSLADHLWFYDHAVGLTLRHAPGLFSRDRSDFALQIAHAGLTRIAMDHFA